MKFNRADILKKQEVALAAKKAEELVSKADDKSKVKPALNPRLMDSLVFRLEADKLNANFLESIKAFFGTQEIEILVQVIKEPIKYKSVFLEEVKRQLNQPASSKSKLEEKPALKQTISKEKHIADNISEELDVWEYRNKVEEEMMEDWKLMMAEKDEEEYHRDRQETEEITSFLDDF